MSTLDYTPYKLTDWYPKERLRFDYLSTNPRAIGVLEKNISLIDWWGLCKNPQGIQLVEQNLDQLKDTDWINLCRNPLAVSIIEKNLEKLNHRCWHELSKNPEATHLLKQNP